MESASQPTAGITNPVAIAHYIYPKQPAPYTSAVDALSALEQSQFKPGTPANDLYQALLVPWVPAGAAGPTFVISVIVFPGEHLQPFADSLRQHGLALLHGVPIVSGAAGQWIFDAQAQVRTMLQLDVGDRVYMFTARGDGPSIRESPRLEDLTRKTGK